MSAYRLFLDLKAQGHAVSEDSVDALLGHLVDAYLLQAVPLHTASERQRNSNPRKIYPADPGLIQAFDVSGRANTGHALETAVFNQLQRLGADTAYGWSSRRSRRSRTGRRSARRWICAKSLRSVNPQVPGSSPGRGAIGRFLPHARDRSR